MATDRDTLCSKSPLDRNYADEKTVLPERGQGLLGLHSVTRFLPVVSATW